jgi:glycosyltransferase involved in cell wall biosynthesis
VRVLIVADIVGGVRTFVTELARELAGAHEVHLGLIGPRSAGPALPVVSCEVADLRLEWMPDSDADVAATAEWVAELCERVRPDILHMNTYADVLDPGVPVLLTAHSCVLTWWRAVHGRDAPLEWAGYQRRVESALARADVVVAPSRSLARELAVAYGRDGARVIHPGRRVMAPPRARERLVVTAGRLWDPAKNVALVAAAANDIEARVVAIGAGDAGGLEHTGELEEAGVLDWLARASVFAEPARYEPFGLAALEAALCGCALVLGDIPSLREVWGDSAQYVRGDDPGALAATVNRLLADPVRRARAARAASSRGKRYSPRQTAQQYLEVYASAAAARLGAPAA